jgi:hypothetical protein
MIPNLEADLISAAARGKQHLIAELQKKLAAMDLDADDRGAILDAMMDKTAGPLDATSSFSSRMFPILGLGAMIAPAMIQGARWLSSKANAEPAWQRIQVLAPDLMQQDPYRARSLFKLLHGTAPSIAANTDVAVDILRQMMAMPSVDLGTIKGLTGISKDLREPIPTVPGKDIASTVQMIRDPNPYTKRSSVLNWSTQACKNAGITDAFMGSGTAFQQANNQARMTDAQMGLPLLPLDAIVQELLQKEQELMAREDILAQQEAQMQQAQAMMNQMGSAYQNQYGVSPSGEITGQMYDSADGSGAPEDGTDADEQMPGPDATGQIPGSGPGTDGMAPDDGTNAGAAAAAAPGYATFPSDAGSPDATDADNQGDLAAANGPPPGTEEAMGPGGAALGPADQGQGGAPEEGQVPVGDETGAALPPSAELGGAEGLAPSGANAPEMGADQGGALPPSPADTVASQDQGAGAPPAPAATMIIPLPSLQISVKFANRQARIDRIYQEVIADLFAVRED